MNLVKRYLIPNLYTRMRMHDSIVTFLAPIVSLQKFLIIEVCTSQFAILSYVETINTSTLNRCISSHHSQITIIIMFAAADPCNTTIVEVLLFTQTHMTTVKY